LYVILVEPEASLGLKYAARLTRRPMLERPHPLDALVVLVVVEEGGVGLEG
jgi:hypothetical protein